MADPKKKDKEEMERYERMKMEALPSSKDLMKSLGLLGDFVIPREPLPMPPPLTREADDEESIIDMMSSAATRPMRGSVFDPYLRTTPTYNEMAVDHFKEVYNELHPVMPNPTMGFGHRRAGVDPRTAIEGGLMTRELMEEDPGKGRRDLRGTQPYRSNVPGEMQPRVYARRPEDEARQPALDDTFERMRRRNAGGLTAAGPTGMIEKVEKVPYIEEQHKKMRSIYNNASPEQRQQMDAYIQRMRSSNPRGE